jgi:hypothetical protein
MSTWSDNKKDILKIRFMESTPEDKKIAVATVAQLAISIVVVIGMMITSWVTLQSNQAEMRVRIEMLEKGRQQNADNIETIRTENRDDHKEILYQLQEINRFLISTDIKSTHK